MINAQFPFILANDLEVEPIMLPSSQFPFQTNPNQANLFVRSNHPYGFSVIEVLTSIVVAMIGVLGVMILVPFAIRQAQTGLDIEASSVVARNAAELFEIGGYRNRSNWIVSPDPTDPTTLVPANFPGIPIQPYSIDPLGLTDTTGMANYAAAAFPFNLDPNSAAVYPGNLRIQAANLRLPLSGVRQFQRGDATRMFVARDDLIFGESIDSIAGNDATFNGPTQIFDVVADVGIPVRRQASGAFSWSAMVVPDLAASMNTYRLHILVYKDRATDPTVVDTTNNFSNSPHMRAARVAVPPTWTNMISPVSTVQMDAASVFPPGSIKSDDWAMLINRRILPGGDLGPFQIGFYRIVNHRDLNLTLNGPDFNFNSADFTPTFVVHLKNVVGVYERTIAPESSSNWNSTF